MSTISENLDGGTGTIEFQVGTKREGREKFQGIKYSLKTILNLIKNNETGFTFIIISKL